MVLASEPLYTSLFAELNYASTTPLSADDEGAVFYVGKTLSASIHCGKKEFCPKAELFF